MDPDVLMEAVVASANAADAVELCIPLLRQEGTGLAAVTALLERIRMGIEGEGGIQIILRAVRHASAPRLAICDQLLHLLPLVQDPQQLISTIPQLVADGGVSDVTSVIQEYKRLLNEDRTILVHVIGSLHDLPLRNSARSEVSAMTLEHITQSEKTKVQVLKVDRKTSGLLTFAL
ncbi:unnamed protein product [Choristocarpus tenellus]